MVVKSPVARRGCAVDCRCCAQRAVHLGRMRRKRGVWGEVDDVLSVGSRCWGRAVGPRRRGWRRRCEGWLPASSCPVAACGGCQLVRALLSRLVLLSGGNCDHRGATRRRHAVMGVLWSQNPPLRGGVVRWIVGVVLNVQSTSAGYAEKVVFGARWTTF